MSERYQREIEEILQQVGEGTPNKESKQTGRGFLLAPLSRFFRGVGAHLYLSSGRLMTIIVVLLLSAILVSAIFPGLLGPFVWLGLILFILGYALFFARPGSKMEPRWRGRPVDQLWGGRGESAWERFQRWLKR